MKRPPNVIYGPAALLMDLNLPGMSGWEATRRLKADAGTRAIPVVALTAPFHFDHCIVERASSCGHTTRITR
ncbi:MAG: hypothetical protein ACREVP_08560 [Burkholderiales bacterium]